MKKIIKSICEKFTIPGLMLLGIIIFVLLLFLYKTFFE